ncbi:unnamed protein product [marine sediment metagenome]|uniref:Uncharacterized protein n=1 Tax=marine sediment metagenome TaxID=412755 RepID=X1E6G1_9ZZZZ
MKKSLVIGIVLVTLLLFTLLVSADELNDEIIIEVEASGDMELRDACEQIGLRRDGEYCSDAGVYVEQKTGGQYCDNHFECESNVCISDECVKEGLIKKIMNFFKRLFRISTKELTSEEAQAIELADESAFGKFSGWYGDVLERGNNCDFDMFVSISEKTGMVMDEEEKDSLKPYFDSVKQCLPSLEKKAEKIEGDKYQIIYSFESTSSCKKLVEELIMSSQLKSIHNQAVVVDLKTKEVEMPDAPAVINSWENAYELLETQMKQIEAIYKEDIEAIIDCSMVGSFAMFQYMKLLTPEETSSAEEAISVPEVPTTEEAIPVPETPTKTADECEEITRNDQRGICYFDVAIETNDDSLCEEITDNIYKHVCSAITTDDSSLCEELTDSSDKDKCYSRVAIRIYDVNLCEKITDTSTADSCYFIVAYRTNESNLCEKITKISGISSRDTCYNIIAQKTKDSSPCEK